MWDCDAEGSYLVEMPPDEDPCGHLDGVLGGGVHDEDLADQDVTTPRCGPCGASCSTDGEATPLFSSDFPRQADRRELWDEENLLEEPVAAGDAPVNIRLK